MIKPKKVMGCLLMAVQFLIVPMSWGGPYAPAVDEVGSQAIAMDDPALISWATDYRDYVAGDNVDETWQLPENGLGRAEGTSFDIVALGSGGRITLIFDPPVENGAGWDFVVFENSFSDQYLELAYVEVSSNGSDFVRFDSISLTVNPVPGFGNTDPTDMDGLAGKYRQGFGTPFDLETLVGKPGVLAGDVDLSKISHVRIIDVVGDGTFLDTRGEVIYDPYPTAGSAGFDLDAVGVSNGAPYPAGEYIPPDLPQEDGDAGFGGGTGCFITTIQ